MAVYRVADVVARWTDGRMVWVSNHAYAIGDRAVAWAATHER
jgi:hypothetical protein